MPIQDKYLADLTEDKIYHIYNRTNNRELLFKTDENRSFFLRRFDYYLSPYLGTYCWSLLPNHFHFLVRIKAAEEISKWLLQQEKLKSIEKKYLDGHETSACLLERAFQQFFTSYAMAFNNMHMRSGNLFHRPFKRVEVAQGSHFTNAVIYIHANPVKHGLVTDFTQYPWSSWKSIIDDRPSSLLKNELIDWFGSKENLIVAHQNVGRYYESDIAIEE